MPNINTYLSKNTFKMVNDEKDTLIKKYSEEFGVEESLIRAIISQESNDYPFACRIENHLRKQKWYLKTIPSKYKKDPYAYCSMGYMQILYGVARDYGFKGSPIELMLGENSIKYGVRHLQQLGKRYKQVDSVISAYNQGSDRKFPAGHAYSGKFRNKEYVAAVLKRIK